jgi:hypothetical protein
MIASVEDSTTATKCETSRSSRLRSVISRIALETSTRWFVRSGLSEISTGNSVGCCVR